MMQRCLSQFTSYADILIAQKEPREMRDFDLILVGFYMEGSRFI